MKQDESDLEIRPTFPGTSSNLGKRRLYLEIMEQLEFEIQEGKYLPESRLPPEKQLAEQYKVSRPTIREAILALEVRGFVEARVGSGIYVLGTREETGNHAECFSEELLSPFEILEARKIIEGEIMLEAARKGGRSDLLHLRQNLNAQHAVLQRSRRETPQQRPNTEFLDLDREFHLQIALMTQNLALYQTVKYLWEMRNQNPLWQKLNEHFGKEVCDFEKAVLDHEVLCNTLERREGGLARDLLHEHLVHTRKSLMDLAGVEKKWEYN